MWPTGPWSVMGKHEKCFSNRLLYWHIWNSLYLRGFLDFWPAIFITVILRLCLHLGLMNTPPVSQFQSFFETIDILSTMCNKITNVIIFNFSSVLSGRQISAWRTTCTTPLETTLCRTSPQTTCRTQPVRRPSSTTPSSPSGLHIHHLAPSLTLSGFVPADNQNCCLPVCVAAMRRRSCGWRCARQTRWLCPSWLPPPHATGCQTTWTLKVCAHVSLLLLTAALWLHTVTA